MKIDKCESCGWHLAPDKCRLLKIYVKPQEDFCSKHRINKPKTCDICKKEIIKGGILDSVSETIHLICDDCRKLFGTCHLCDNAKFCEFESNSSSLPKMIQKQIQQGPYQMVTTVRNPERIRITCEKGCECFDAKNGCLRETSQSCSKNKYTY